MRLQRYTLIKNQNLHILKPCVLIILLSLISSISYSRIESSDNNITDKTNQHSTTQIQLTNLDNTIPKLNDEYFKNSIVNFYNFPHRNNLAGETTTAIFSVNSGDIVTWVIDTGVAVNRYVSDPNAVSRSSSLTGSLIANITGNWYLEFWAWQNYGWSANITISKDWSNGRYLQHETGKITTAGNPIPMGYRDVYFDALNDTEISWVTSGYQTVPIAYSARLITPDGVQVVNSIAASFQANMTGTWRLYLQCIGSACDFEASIYATSSSVFSFNTSPPNNEIKWKFTDNSPTIYEFWSDGSIIDQGNWDNNTEIILDAGILTHGSHEVILKVLDNDNNQFVDRILLDISDNSVPIITSTGDINFNYEERLGKKIDWNMSDSSSFSYILYKNSEVDSSSSDIPPGNHTFTVPLDNLDIGTYVFRLDVEDFHSNAENHTVYVNITDSGPPSITLLGYDNGITVGGNTDLSFTVTDDHLISEISYKWGHEINETNLDNNTESFSIAAPSSPGTYNITLIVKDTVYINSTTFFITVDITQASVTSDQAGGTYLSGTNIQVTITDSDLAQVEYHWDDEILNQTEIPSGTQVVLNATLPEGDGPHTLYVYYVDELGNSGFPEYVFYTDDNPASITGDLIINLNQTNSMRLLDWEINDTSNLNVTLYLDGNPIMNDILNTNKFPYTLEPKNYINLTNLGLGSYNFTLIVVDIVYNKANFTTWFNILDDQLPIITINYLSNLFLPNTILKVGVSDNVLQGLNIQIQWNDGTWDDKIQTDGDIITNTPLTDGTHNLRIIIEDQRGNRAEHVYSIIVDGTGPNITPLGGLSTDTPYIIKTEIITIKADIIDTNGVERVEIWIENIKESNANLESENQYSYELDFSNSIEGDYILEFKAYDILGNIGKSGNITLRFQKDITSETAPQTSTSTSVETSDTTFPSNSTNPPNGSPGLPSENLVSILLISGLGVFTAVFRYISRRRMDKVFDDLEVSFETAEDGGSGKID